MISHNQSLIQLDYHLHLLITIPVISIEFLKTKLHLEKRLMTWFDVTSRDNNAESRMPEAECRWPLYIHYLFRKFTINILAVSQIHCIPTICFNNSLWIRHFFRFTVYPLTVYPIKYRLGGATYIISLFFCVNFTNWNSRNFKFNFRG